MDDDIQVRVMEPGLWDDLTKLFGPHGASGGCWCMFFREPVKEFQINKGEGNKALFLQVIKQNKPTGLLAYKNGQPAGWIAIAPREDYPRILKSRNYKPVDDEKVWSITCFYIARAYRGTGIHRALIRAAIDFARENQAEWIEAYPVDTKNRKIQDASAYTGIFDSFIELGFIEIARRSPNAPIVRYSIQSHEGA